MRTIYTVFCLTFEEGLIIMHEPDNADLRGGDEL